MKQTKQEIELLDKANIKNVDKVKAEDISKLSSLIINSKEIASDLYVNLIGKVDSISNKFIDLCDKLYVKADENTKMVIASYRDELKNLIWQSKKPELTNAELKEIFDRISIVNEKITEVDREHKNFVLKILGGVAAFCMAIIAIIFPPGKK